MKKLTITLAAILAIALPGSALAATYAYVNVSDEVRTVEAPTPEQAITTAPSIAARSGVILLMSGMLSELTGGSNSNNDNSNDEDNDNNTEAADELREDMRTLFSEHVEYSLDVLRLIEDGDSDEDMLDDAMDRQMENAEDLGAAVASVYGDDAGDMFEEMFKEHIDASNAYTQALVDGDDEAADEALDELTEYLEEISAFLAGANPNIDEDTLLNALADHEDLVNEASEAYVDGDEDESDDLEDEAIEQIRGAADYLVDAIIMQFPDKF